jgi:hypothetical protein
VSGMVGAHAALPVRPVAVMLLLLVHVIQHPWYLVVRH